MKSTITRLIWAKVAMASMATRRSSTPRSIAASLLAQERLILDHLGIIWRSPLGLSAKTAGIAADGFTLPSGAVFYGRNVSGWIASPGDELRQRADAAPTFIRGDCDQSNE